MNKQQVVLLTGASSGIGFETAKLLAKSGFKVYGAARRVKKIAALASLGVIPVKLDLTDEKSIIDAVETVIADAGHIDVLVNNAGFGYFGAIEQVSIAAAREQFEVNLFGLARLVQCVLPHMRTQQRGRIINITSLGGRATTYMGAWYHATKYALEAFSDALRMEAKPFGIDVAIIEPGGIKTDWGKIAANHLRQSSKGSIYEVTGNETANRMEKIYDSNSLSSSYVIAKAILRASSARKPRTRYLIGAGAKSGLLFHTILPTRWFDAIIKRVM